jgi:hypothetical protein
MSRYTNPRWWWQSGFAARGYYGDEGVGRSGCYCVHVEDDGKTWFVVPPNDELWPDIVFPTLEAAKTWVEIEASNHV